MQRPSRVLAALVFIALGWSAAVSAQTTAAPAAAAVAPAPAAATAGIQSQNIFQVKPDASADPNYASQTNGERAKVQPGNNAPMWRQVGAGVTGVSSLPKSEAPEAGNLIQPFVQYPGSRLTNAGEAWRQVRNNWIIPYGGSLFLIVVLAIAIFYFTKGSIKNHGADTGRKIERFTPFERAAHWSNAIAFSILAISGLVMAFGKFFLLPVMGSTLFGWLTYVLKTAHNFAGPLFAVSLVVVFFTFLRDNWPQKGDLQWLAKGGGLISGDEPASNRFNAGEKLIFWGGVFFLGIIVVASGLVLDKLLPGLIYERGTMQVAHMVHAVATVLMMCMFLGHIYLGTIGMQGAYKAMRTGYVDETWAKDHHEYWYDDVKAGKIPAQRSEPIPPGQTVQV
ncbi:formate dehydrogenase subunit gamma [Polaromonas eurypsychrophila]|uniref:Formate dehydrogenase subunit gamma n=1 Tax=Polaromonas eurypsychrophila TaxID=1614635 RepID=A0A916SAG4_9BURK|nr:formate dehydrogenase subunit gamma [Polaromonas eurypsychrophila]GGA91163.1 formate dehydrogenase subunit gamma [Polaromonas eurypsychrophila]